MSEQIRLWAKEEYLRCQKESSNDLGEKALVVGYTHLWEFIGGHSSNKDKRTLEMTSAKKYFEEAQQSNDNTVKSLALSLLGNHFNS